MSVKVYPPAIVITLPSSQDQPHLSSSVKCSLWCETYKRMIIFLGILFIIAVMGAVIAISRGSSTSTSVTNPCETYKADDFASGVSLACFRTMWTNAGCKMGVPNNYAGWYLRSPDGGRTVICIPPKTGNLCGAGSFGTIQNSIWRCDLEYKGY